jgi:DNA polymerase V
MRAGSPVPVPLDTALSLQLPLFSSYVRAGFPNPADDHRESDIDLNALLIHHPAATFLLRVAGESMIGVGIYPEDIVVVDRSLSVQQRDVVVAEVEGEFLIKRFLRQNGSIVLAPENPAFRPLTFTPEMELTIFGVVTFTLHRHRSRRWRR